MDLIDHWAQEIRRLEQEIVKARQAALSSRARTSYFVFFTSQKDAAIAAQTNLHPEDGHAFRVYEAPGPEEVSMESSFKILKHIHLFPNLASKSLGTMLSELLLTCCNALIKSDLINPPYSFLTRLFRDEFRLCS